MPKSDQTDHIISYAPPLTAPQRLRRYYRWLIPLTAIASLVVGGPPLVRKLKRSIEFRRCVRFSLAPEQIVYDEDPKTAASLINGAKGYVAIAVPGRNPPGATFDFDCWDHFAAPFGPWVRYPLFLHVSNDDNGRPAITAFMVVHSGSSIAFEWETISADGETHDVYKSSAQLVDKGGNLVEISPTLRFFAAQSDSHDPSRVWLKYETNGKPGILDVWLKNRKVGVRSGPLLDSLR